MADNYNLSYTRSQVDTAIGRALNPDTTPTSGHTTKLVTSHGVAAKISELSDSVNTQVTQIGSKLDEYTGMDISIDAAEISTGYIAYSDGTLRSSPNYRIYKFGNLDNSERISAKVADIDTAQAAIAFYSSNEISNASYISGIRSQAANPYEVDGIIPTGCVMIVVTNRNAIYDSPTVHITSDGIGATKEDVARVETQINDDIARVETQIGGKVSEISKAIASDELEEIIFGEAENDPTLSIKDKEVNVNGTFKVNGEDIAEKIDFPFENKKIGEDPSKVVIFAEESEEDPTMTIKDKEVNVFGDFLVNGAQVGSTAQGRVEVGNSDCITILGSSFGQTDVFPSNKHWSGILSLFSDYQFQNNSAGGSNKVTNLYFLRSGSWVARGNYVMVANDENIGTMTIAQVTKALDNICRTIIGMGKTPIICTSYHKTAIQSAAFKDYAYRHNLMFWDAAAYCSSLYSGINTAFDDGAHLRRRNIAMVADAYFNHHHLMERPFKSMKVFRVRESFNGSLDDLVFTTNEERAKDFKEITISSASNQDEYKKLIDGTALSFSRYALVSCVLPANAKDLTRLVFSLATSADVSVYARNTMAAPYPSPSSSTMMRFSVSETISLPSENDVYSIGGVNYTVGYVKEGENNYFCTIYCTPSTMPSSQSGTLSKVLGSGPSSIPYVMAETASYDVTEFLDDNCGHWVEIQGSDNVFEIEDIDKYVDIDKVHLLVAYNGTFTAKDFSVAYSALALKDRTFSRDFVWEQNSYYNTTELIQEPNFGAIGASTSWWKDGSNNAITSVGNVGNKFPFGLSSEIVVTNALSMNATIPSSSLTRNGQLVFEVCCRYFPTAPSPYTQANDTNVSDDSYDYNTLFAKLGDMVFEKEIGLMWKFVRIPIPWYYQTSSSPSLTISMYSDIKGIEICNVSLKYVE